MVLLLGGGTGVVRLAVKAAAIAAVAAVVEVVRKQGH